MSALRQREPQFERSPSPLLQGNLSDIQRAVPGRGVARRGAQAARAAVQERNHPRTDAVPPPEINATTRQAVNRALRSNGWDADEGQAKCPACLEDAA